MKWIYPDNITEQDILESSGFVYKITNLLNNKEYIGKKFVYSFRTKIVNGKRKKTKTVSDWKTYQGSCEPLKLDIEMYGEENFKKEIISIHRTRTETNYTEIELQMKNDVLRAKNELGEFKFYNGNILHKFFRNNIK
ncbi:hypothetical protein [Acetobacter tropicalis]|uniref:hypothetical protein n=1 Tax=Acetobacter tropicalis TaxID=104102 RepID=UPI000586A107|nr:hypothetical protein [Acetobacter tropicalis]